MREDFAARGVRLFQNDLRSIFERKPDGADESRIATAPQGLAKIFGRRGTSLANRIEEWAECRERTGLGVSPRAVPTQSGGGRPEPFVQDVEFSHAAEFARQPFQIDLDRFSPVRIEEPTECAEFPAKPAGGRPKSMNALDGAPPDFRFVRLNPSDRAGECRPDDKPGRVGPFDPRNRQGLVRASLNRNSVRLNMSRLGD